MPRPVDLPDPAAFAAPPPPAQPVLPLQGLTILAVEDSRYACDALRLLCQRSGARLRRAETLQAAQAHLRCYRPDVVIVDLGLPDGRGEELIRSLARSNAALVLGSSGDPDGRVAALAAGAAGFLEKPVSSLALFQSAILAHVFDHAAPPEPFAEELRPDPLCLADDVMQAVAALEAGPDAGKRRYLAGFLSGLARQSRDTLLAQASHALRQPGGLTDSASDQISGLLRAHMAGHSAFGPRHGSISP